MKLTLWLPLILLLIFAGVTFWLDHLVKNAPSKPNGGLRHDIDYSVENFAATRLSPDGKPLYQLSASRMVHYPDDETTHLSQPRFTQFEAQQPPLHISAQRGLVSKDGGNVYLMDGVKVLREASATQSALTVTTPYLHIIPDAHVAKTNRSVVIKDSNTLITATGFEINNKTRIAKLHSRVRAQYDNPRK